MTAKTADTVAGATNGVEMTDTQGGVALEWLSDPVSAAVTIAGTITANLWAAENNMSANVAINVVIDKVSGVDGAITQIVKSTRVTELAVTTRAVNNFTTGMLDTDYAEVSLARGDRLRIRVFGDDAGTMASGFTFSFGYDDDVASADGDSYVTFTENITFEALTTPSGSTLYLTNTTMFASSDTGLTAGGTYESVARASGVAWSNPGNASASDDSYATSAMVGNGSAYLVCRNLGFDLPSGVSMYIHGIEYEVEGKVSSGTATMTVQFQNAGGLIGASVTHTLTTTDQTFTGGGLGTTLGEDYDGFDDAAMVEGVNFGVRVWLAGAENVTASIDRIRVKVYYGATPFSKEAWTSRGGGVQELAFQYSAGGYQAPKLWGKLGVLYEWYSKRLTAFTLEGVIMGNIRCRENAATDNASVGLQIAITDEDGANPTVLGYADRVADTTNGSVGELPTTEAAHTIWLSGSVSVADGKRIRIRVFEDDCANASGVGGTPSRLYYAGTTGGASGDTYVVFPQTLTEYVPAAPISHILMPPRIAT